MKTIRAFLICLLVLSLLPAAVAAKDAAGIRDRLFLAIAELPDGTAGSSLRQAEAVCGLWSLSGTYRFDQYEPDALAQLLREAWSLLPEDAQAGFAEKAPAVLAEAERLLDPAAQPDGRYEDAGVSGTLEALRSDQAARDSAAALLSALAAYAAENAGQE